MPNPVSTRQPDRISTFAALAAPSMPIVISTRHDRMVARRPIRSAIPPRNSDPTAMPISSIDSTSPRPEGPSCHSSRMPLAAKLIDSTSNPSSALSPTIVATTPHWKRDIGA